MSARRVAFSSRKPRIGAHGAALWLLAALPLCPGTARAQDAPPPLTPPTALPVAAPAPAAYRDPASGVEVFTAIDDAMFPETWHEASIAATAAPLSADDPAARARAVNVLKTALSKYPADVLRQNLERVYVVGDLRFRGIRAAGTNSLRRVFIKIEPDDPLYTDSFIEESFHHEFAHILRRNYEDVWDDEAWTRALPPDFRYGAGGGVDAVKAGKSSLWITGEWAKKGFLGEYGASDPSEDFATFGGGLLTGDPAFWKAVDTYPLLRAKELAAVTFYGHIAASLNEAYFRGLHAGVPLPVAATVSPAPTAKPEPPK